MCLPLVFFYTKHNIERMVADQRRNEEMMERDLMGCKRRKNRRRRRRNETCNRDQRESQTMPSACATSGKYSTAMTMMITTGIYLVFPCVKIYSKSFAYFISFIPHAIP